VRKSRRKDWIDEDRAAAALEGFSETLESFCSAVLTNGKRIGNDWCVGDLDNSKPGSDKNGSCSICIAGPKAGLWVDRNPSADYRGGNAYQLWQALFGVENYGEVIKGIEAWLERGDLPDGHTGLCVRGEVRLSEDEVILPRDDYEKELVSQIRTYKNWIENSERRLLALLEWSEKDGAFLVRERWLNKYGQEEVSGNVYIIPGTVDPGLEVRQAEHDTIKREQIEKYEQRIRLNLSRLYRYRYVRAVHETQAIRADVAQALSEYRGLSADVFKWLVDQRQIALYQPQRVNKYGEAIEVIDIVFPVIRPDQFDPELGQKRDFDARWSEELDFITIKHPREWVDTVEGKDWLQTKDGKAQVEEETRRGYPYLYWFEHEFFGSADEFLSMHCKWGWVPNSEKSGWRYEPKGRGMEPWIVGDLSKAETILISESPWDLISFTDCYELYRDPESFAFIATRGASGAKKVPARDKINPDATILLILQNDQANAQWHADLPIEIQRDGRRVIPPPELKDFNDWMKRDSKEQIKRSLQN
jgi:hypothetical protein